MQSERGAKRCYMCNREGHNARDCRAESKKPAHQASQTHGKRPSIQQPPYNFEKKTEDRGETNSGGGYWELLTLCHSEPPGCTSLWHHRQWVRYHHHWGKFVQKNCSTGEAEEEGPLQTRQGAKNLYQQTFALDGRLDLEVSFNDRTMKTAVYLKRDAHDQLLLSEGVCRQLGLSHITHVQSRGGEEENLLIRKRKQEFLG